MKETPAAEGRAACFHTRTAGTCRPLLAPTQCESRPRVTTRRRVATGRPSSYQASRAGEVALGGAACGCRRHRRGRRPPPARGPGRRRPSADRRIHRRRGAYRQRPRAAARSPWPACGSPCTRRRSWMDGWMDRGRDPDAQQVRRGPQLVGVCRAGGLISPHPGLRTATSAYTPVTHSSHPILKIGRMPVSLALDAGEC